MSHRSRAQSPHGTYCFVQEAAPLSSTSSLLAQAPARKHAGQAAQPLEQVWRKPVLESAAQNNPCRNRAAGLYLPTRAVAKAAPPRTKKVLPECWPHKPELFAPGRSQMTRPLQESFYWPLATPKPGPATSPK